MFRIRIRDDIEDEPFELFSIIFELSCGKCVYVKKEIKNCTVKDYTYGANYVKINEQLKLNKYNLSLKYLYYTINDEYESKQDFKKLVENILEFMEKIEKEENCVLHIGDVEFECKNELFCMISCKDKEFKVTVLLKEIKEDVLHQMMILKNILEKLNV